MSIFSKFFTSSSAEDTGNPEIQFGKYSDRNKTPEQLENWKKSVALFEEQNYLDAFEEFFKYLKDPKIDNVKYSRKSEEITFELFQGSKNVTGYINNDEVYAVSEVVTYEKTNIAVMRRLLSENYFLWYSKFSKTKDAFTIRHRAPVKEEHPTTLYYSLKEVANVSDSFDDVLVDEFTFLKPINIEHIEQLPDAELKIKLASLKNMIADNLKIYHTLDANKFTGARSFTLLNLLYKIYYLYAPEGTLLDDIRLAQSIFWQNNNMQDTIRNQKMLAEIEKIQKMSDEEITKSLYKVKATFPVVKPTPYRNITDFVKKEIEKIHWYRENKYYDIHQKICEYIISFSTYTHGVEPVIHELFQVFWKVTNHEYFEELGFKDNFVKKNKINMHAIDKKISRIISNYRTTYPKLTFNTKH